MTMTDNEIIKALECCAMSSYPACRDCPCHEQYNNYNCITKRNDDIKDLINRLQGEKDGLQKLVNLSIDTQNEMNDTITEQKAEIERLSDLLKRHQRNTRRIRMINAETAKKIKAEAIKEFAESLTNSILPQLGISTLEKKDAYYFCLIEIEKLLEEMVGDTQ